MEKDQDQEKKDRRSAKKTKEEKRNKDKESSDGDEEGLEWLLPIMDSTLNVKKDEINKKKSKKTQREIKESESFAMVFAKRPEKKESLIDDDFLVFEPLEKRNNRASTSSNASLVMDTIKAKNKLKKTRKKAPQPQVEEIENQDNISSSSYVEPEPEPKPNPKSKPIQKPRKDDVFGYLSKINDPVKFLFRRASIVKPISEDDILEDAQEKDMTWLRKLSASETSEDDEVKTGRQHFTDSLFLYWTFLKMGCRMPFQFVRCKSRGSGAVSCTFDRYRRTYIQFLLSSCILIPLTCLAVFTFGQIFFADEEMDDPFTQIEKLLMDKNWVAGLVFVNVLILASVSSIVILIQGESMAAFITQSDECLTMLNFSATAGAGKVTDFVIFFLVLRTVGHILMFYFMRKLLNPYIEGLHLMTVIICRNIYREILLSKYRDHVVGAIIFIDTYAFYCASNFILLLILYAVGIKNVAHAWNYQLRRILRQGTLAMLETREILTEILETSYEKLFEQHRKIVDLMEKTSEAFSTILVTFYIIMAFLISAQLLELSVYITGHAEPVVFNTTRAQRVNYTYDKSSYNILALGAHMSQTFGIFMFVSLYLSATGEAVMESLCYVVRHGYMNIMSTHQRNFIMSLMMSFNPRQPYLLRAGKLFSIDRAFILAFFAGTLYFFSVMVQTKFPRLLTYPIIFPCDSPTGLCTRTGIKRFDENIFEKVPRLIKKAKIRIETRFPCKIGDPSIVNKLRKQRYICPAARIARYFVYNATGVQQLKVIHPWKCIADPYPPGVPYFDCFGNELKERDDCGMLNFRSTLGLPKRKSFTVDNGRAGIAKFSCFDFGSDYYPSEWNNDDWYPCGMPKWFIPTLCKRNPPNSSPGITEMRDNLRNILTYEYNFQGTCTPTKNTRYTDLIQMLDDSNFQSLEPVSKLVNFHLRYFPFFHPSLFGKELNSVFLHFCTQSGTVSKVQMNPDGCGGLDFAGQNITQQVTHMVNNVSTTFYCYDPSICDSKICSNWMEFIKNPPF